MMRSMMTIAMLLTFVSGASADSWKCAARDGDGRCIKKVRESHIMGMPAKKYIRGIQQGKCMPSPTGVPGVCGGG